MTDLERFLRDRNADADTWVDDEGLHVHDWKLTFVYYSMQTKVITTLFASISMHSERYPSSVLA